MAGEDRILIVRHGKDRGPKVLSGAMAPILEYIERQRPELHRRLQLHQTGEAAPSLGGIGVVIFWLAGPLNNHPACYEDAVRIANEARARDLTVINPPEALYNLSKTRQAQLWQEAGIRCSPVETFEDLATLKDAADRLAFPLMLRADARHRQAGAAVVRDRSALLALSESELSFPCAVSPFVDVREGYRSTAPNSVYARRFHKNRLWVANDVIRTKHVFFSSDPVVSSKTAILGAAARSGIPEYAILLSPYASRVPSPRCCFLACGRAAPRADDQGMQRTWAAIRGDRLQQSCRRDAHSVGSQSGVPGSPSPPDDIATVAARRRAGRQLLRSDRDVPDWAARRPRGGGGRS